MCVREFQRLEQVTWRKGQDKNSSKCNNTDKCIKVEYPQHKLLTEHGSKNIPTKIRFVLDYEVVRPQSTATWAEGCRRLILRKLYPQNNKVPNLRNSLSTSGSWNLSLDLKEQPRRLGKECLVSRQSLDSRRKDNSREKVSQFIIWIYIVQGQSIYRTKSTVTHRRISLNPL